MISFLRFVNRAQNLVYFCIFKLVKSLTEDAKWLSLGEACRVLEVNEAPPSVNGPITVTSGSTGLPEDTAASGPGT